VGACIGDNVDVLRTPRRGTSSRAFTQEARTGLEGCRKIATRAPAERVLHSVLGSVLVDRHYTPAAKVFGGGAVATVSQSGKPGGSQEGTG
jgi:hypothetical protein